MVVVATSTVVFFYYCFSTPWWWYYGITQTRLDELLTENNARILDLDAYRVNGETRFAVIMGSNEGQYERSWRYAYGTRTFVTQIAEDHNARIVDLDTYTLGNQQGYAAVMVSNLGDQEIEWWHYDDVSIQDLLGYVRQHQARVISIDRLDSGNYTAILVQDNQPGWFYVGQSSQDLYKKVKRNGARLVDLNSYTINGRTFYVGAMVNNLNTPGLRMRRLLHSQVTSGQLGAYVKQVGGPILTNYNGYDIFEPASSIKTLHHLTAMLEVQEGRLSLDAQLPYCDEITGNSCPVRHVDCNQPTTDDVATLAQNMMQISSNQATQSFRAYLGEDLINQVAQSVGMNDTLTQHRIGCGSDPRGDFGLNSQPNQLTLHNIGLLHEAVANGLLTGDVRTFFWDAMTNQLSFIDSIIEDEAAELGLSSETVTRFKAAAFGARKGGSYNSSGYSYRSGTGIITLPFRCNGIVHERSYVFGIYVHRADQFNDFNTWTNTGEVLREVIREALSTW